MKNHKMTRRKFLKFAGASLAVAAFSGYTPLMAEKAKAAENSGASYGTDGSKYVPYEKRTGAESVVYFTRDLSAAGLVRIFDRVKGVLGGKVAIKVHTGEPHGPNIIPRPWVKELMASRLPDATIIETNTYYDGGRYTTEDHRETLAVNGWDFAPVDITDEHGTALLPVPGGKWSRRCRWGRGCWTTIPSWRSPISRGIRWAASAAPTRISASAARTARSERSGSIPPRGRGNGASPRKNSWSA